MAVYIRTATVVVVLAAWAIANGPTTQPAVTPANRALAETFYNAAIQAKASDEAMRAAEAAIRYDPGHIPARLLLAEKALDGRQFDKAREQAEELVRILASAGERPADAAQRLDRIRNRLIFESPSQRAWQIEATRFADLYIRLSEEKGAAGLPSAEWALARAAALCPGVAHMGVQYDNAVRSRPSMPAPVEKVDADGAKLLHEQARKLLRVAKFEDAGRQLESACMLNPDDPELWADLATSYQRRTPPNLTQAAWAAVFARKRLGNIVEEPAARELAARIDLLLSAVDPWLQRLDRLDKQLGPAIGRHIRQARDGGENTFADELETLADRFDLPLADGTLWTDLLPLLNLPGGGQASWELADGRLTALRAHDPLAVPAFPLGDYELETVICRTRGGGQFSFVVPVGDRFLHIVIAGWNNRGAGIEELAGRSATENGTYAVCSLANGRRCRLNIAVRSQGARIAVGVDIDGQRLIRWAGPRTALPLADPNRIRRPGAIHLNVSDGNSHSEFHSLRLRMVTGRLLLPISGEGDVTGRVDLAGPLVSWSRGEAGSLLRPTAKAVVFSPDPQAGMRGGNNYARMAIDGLHFGLDYRLRLRVELLEPGKTGKITLATLPDPNGRPLRLGLDAAGKRIHARELDRLRASSSDFTLIGEDQQKEFVAEGRSWEVVTEKREGRITLWCNDRNVLDAALTNDGLAKLGRGQVWIEFGAWDSQPTIRLTLLELSLGSRFLPYRPAATQPDSAASNHPSTGETR